MNLEIGAVFADKYLIQSRLGEGGMGAVYKASQISADRTVAIKFIHNDSFNRQETAERFWREGKLLCELNHPSIPRFYHCGIEKSANTEAPDLYLVMEYVEGRNLRDELERTSSYLPMECLEIFIKIANALACIHEAGVVHRDLKPSNIVMAATGLKIIDFGLSTNTENVDQRLTATGAMVGTPGYMSPEQCRGEPATFASDVYAAGCIFYEVLVGVPPFEADSPCAVIYQHCHEPVRFPVATHTASARLQLFQIIGKCMRKTPENRYQSGSELLEDLEKVHSGAPLIIDEERSPRTSPNFFTAILLIMIACAPLLINATHTTSKGQFSQINKDTPLYAIDEKLMQKHAHHETISDEEISELARRARTAKRSCYSAVVMLRAAELWTTIGRKDRVNKLFAELKRWDMNKLRAEDQHSASDFALRLRLLEASLAFAEQRWEDSLRSLLEGREQLPYMNTKDRTYWTPVLKIWANDIRTRLSPEAQNRYPPIVD